MRIPFKTNAIEGGMRPVIVEGREWTLCTISKHDNVPEEIAGGHPRAQYKYVQLLEDGQRYEYSFEIMFPDDWVQDDEQYVIVHAIHCRHVGSMNLVLHAIGNELEVLIRDEPEPYEENGKTIYYRLRQRRKWIPNQPYRFDCIYAVSPNPGHGFINYRVNGQKWFDYRGKTLMDGDKWPTIDVGLYSPVKNWPADIDYRKMLVRV